MESYKHTGIISFKDGYKEINEKLISLYNSDKNMFMKISDKKEVKYSCLEINLYLLCLLMYSSDEDKKTELKPILSAFYRKFYVNSGFLTSWPDAPTLDEVERYRKLSLRADDMLDETYFRMPALPTPKSSGIASVFLKNLTYSKKKDTFTASKLSFDSNKNMFSFYLIIYLLKDKIKTLMGFGLSNSAKKDKSKDNEVKKNVKNEKLNPKNRVSSDDDLNDNNSDNNLDSDTITAETIGNDEISSSNNSSNNLNIDEVNISSIELTEAKEIPVAEVTPSPEKITLNASLPKSEKNQKSKKSKKK